MSVALAVEGIKLLDVAVWMMNLQLDDGRCFVFEHPDGADSWNRQALKAMAERKGVTCARFDQCMFGLTSKVEGTAIKKRTRFLSNIPGIFDKFNNVMCSGDHDHVACQGYEGGEKRSVHAQRYPEKLVSNIAEAVYYHIKVNMT
jgi:hypothetical protein